MSALDHTLVRLTPAASIHPESINWLWMGWLAAGKLHILAGAPGCGKTTIAMALAAIVTQGGLWPDGTRARPGNVLIWSGEDDSRDTLVPRLLACGADVDHVHFVEDVVVDGGHRPFDPATDIPALAVAIERSGDVSLLVVDSVVSAVKGDSHKNTEVRRALQPLVDLGMQRGCAVLGISHFSKGSTGRDPIERILGSIAFGALARVAFVAAQLPDEDGRLVEGVFCRGKSNLGPVGGGFAYHVEQIELPKCPGVIASRVVWGKPLRGSARKLLAEVDAESNAERRENDSAIDAWLRELLTEEPELTKDEVMRVARSSGFSESSVQRARKRIGARSVQRGFGKNKRAVWMLPNHIHNAPDKEAQNE